MAETSPSPEEQALRRRARRRLVGAIALALLAVVVLPMVFDSEPRPMGNNVDIRIPGQDTPFEPATSASPKVNAPVPAAAPTAAPAAPAPAAAEPAKATVAETKPAPVAAPLPAPKPEAKPAEKPKSESKPAEPAKPLAKPTEPAKPVEQHKPAKAEAKPAPVQKPVAAKVEAAQAASAYFLQLGVFSSESNAKQMQAKVRAAGFKASIMPVGKQFKVRVGPVADKAKALDYEAKLKSKGLTAVLVEQ